jgi:hypothetical protein
MMIERGQMIFFESLPWSLASVSYLLVIKTGRSVLSVQFYKGKSKTGPTN